MKYIHSPFAKTLALSLGLVVAGLSHSAQATTVYWDTNGATAGAGASANGTWDAATTGNWTTSSAGTSATSSYSTANGGSPSTADVVFSAGTDATSTNITLSGAVVANSITVEELMNITSATTTPSLTLGAGGVTINSTVGANTTTWINTLPTILSASQTWTNNASGLFTVNGTITGAASTAVTFGVAGTGNTTLGGIVANGATGGTVAINKTDAGTLVLGGANTYSGGTMISSGTATITNAAGFGTGTVAVSSGGTANLSLGSALTVANAFSGAGTITASNLAGGGANTLALSGVLSGFTGTLNVGSGGTGKLQFTNATQGNVISSSATINVATNGTLFVANALNYGSSLFLNGGTTGEALGQLRIEGGSTWSGNITLNANTTIGANTSGTGTISGVISGSGTGFTKVGGSTLVLSNTNTYTGGTTISVGTLQLGAGGTTGSLSTSSTITDNANLTINRSNAVAQGTDFSGSAITGGGSFTQAGTGTTTLNAANTYTGATTVSAGTLKAGVASVANTSGAFGNNSAVTLANVAGATLDITGFNTQIGSLTGGGTTGGNVTLGAATLTVGGNNTSPAAYAGVISGTNGVLAKIGTGTLALSGANTYTGGTTISAGTITFTNASSFGTGAITSNGGTIRMLGGADLITTNNLVVNSTTTLDVGVLKNWTFNGNISGSGDITRGTTSLTSIYLGGDNSGYTGTFTIQNNGNAVVRFGAASAGSENAKWVDSNTTAGRVSVEFGTGTLKLGSLTGAGGLSGGAFAGTKTIEVGNLGLNETYSGAISETSGDPMAVSKVGTGTWTLSGANSYTGATTVTAGTLSVSSLANGGSNSNIGKSTNVAGNLILNGGTLQYTGAAVSTDRLFSLQSSSTIDASGSGAVNFTNTGSMGFNGGTAAKTLTLTGASTGANTLAAIIGDNTGATSITKSGTGSWTLSGANTYTGATTVSAGTLTLSNALALQNSALDTTNSIAGTSTAGLKTTVTTLTMGGLTGNKDLASVFTTTAGGYSAVTALTLNPGTGVTNAYSGAIANGAAGMTLTKTGLGTQTLSGTNTFTGATTISNGTLAITGTQALGSTSLVNIANGATLGYTGTASTFAKNITITSGTGTISNTGSGTLGLSGTLTKLATTLALSGNFSVTGIITGSSGVFNSDVNITSGTTTYSTAQGYFGATNVFSGATLVNGIANALPTSTVLNLGGSYNLGGYNQQVAGITTLSGSPQTITNSGTSTLTVNNDSAATSGTTNFTFSGVIADGSGKTSLIKTGDKTLTLTGSNSYSGGTTLTAGTLVAGNDTALGAGLMTFNGGALSSDYDSRTLANVIVVNGVSGNQVSGSSELTFTGTASGAGTLAVNVDAGKQVTVNPGVSNSFAPGRIDVHSGTLLLGDANKVGDATDITLSGGTFATAGNNETVGTLTLSANSSIDLSSAGVLHFADSSGQTWSGILSVYNWAGNPAGGGANQLFFGSSGSGLTGGQLSEVRIYGDGGATFLGNGGLLGSGELVPIPEPATIVGAVAFIGLIVLRERRRLSVFRNLSKHIVTDNSASSIASN